MSREVVVVGGGLAGLAAAVTCADAGASVTVLEARPRLGGAASSFERGALRVDTGTHVLLRCCTAYRGFLRRLGTEHLVDLQPRLDVPLLSPGGRRARLRRTPGLPAPFHLAGSVLRFPWLRPSERLRIAVAAAAIGRVDRDRVELDDDDFGSWLRAHRQTGAAIRRFWDLVALPTLNLPSDAASADLAAMVFQTGLLGDAAAGDIGVSRVPLEDLHGLPAGHAIEAAGGRVTHGVVVTRIEQAGAGFRVHTRDGSLPADAVVAAVPHLRLRELLPPGALPTDLPVERLGATPIVNVHLHLDRPVLDVPFAAAVDSPVQWVFDRTAASGAAEGQLLSISLSAADAEIDVRADELCDRYLAALADILPAARSAAVLDRFVTRDRHATFRQAPRTAALRPPQRTPIPGLAIAGAWTDTGWPATMEGAVRSGLAAAATVLPSLPAAETEEVAA